MTLGFLKKIPLIAPLGSACARLKRNAANPFLKAFAPGHFYSPIPDLDYLRRHRARVFDRRTGTVPGIELNLGIQLALLDRFVEFYADIPFTREHTQGLRYHYLNSYFRFGDAIALHGMLRHAGPRRVVEVGSGFSSAVMLDTNDIFFNEKILFTFIDPYPERLHSLLDDTDRSRCEMIVDEVQNVPLNTFQTLQPGDILFIDSSHVVKTGSDVVHLLTHVLPALSKGVFIHFHDIFWPFEYPEEWLQKGRAWNENHAVKAFMQFNSAFRIIFFNDYIAAHHADALRHKLPLFMEDSGGSLWLEKTA